MCVSSIRAICNRAAAPVARRRRAPGSPRSTDARLLSSKARASGRHRRSSERSRRSRSRSGLAMCSPTRTVSPRPPRVSGRPDAHVRAAVAGRRRGLHEVDPAGHHGHRRRGARGPEGRRRELLRRARRGGSQQRGAPRVRESERSEPAQVPLRAPRRAHGGAELRTREGSRRRARVVRQLPLRRGHVAWLSRLRPPAPDAGGDRRGRLRLRLRHVPRRHVQVRPPAGRRVHGHVRMRADLLVALARSLEHAALARVGRVLLDDRVRGTARRSRVSLAARRDDRSPSRRDDVSDRGLADGAKSRSRAAPRGTTRSGSPRAHPPVAAARCIA